MLHLDRIAIALAGRTIVEADTAVEACRYYVITAGHIIPIDPHRLAGRRRA